MSAGASAVHSRKQRRASLLGHSDLLDISMNLLVDWMLACVSLAELWNILEKLKTIDSSSAQFLLPSSWKSLWPPIIARTARRRPLEYRSGNVTLFLRTNEMLQAFKHLFCLQQILVFHFIPEVPLIESISFLKDRNRARNTVYEATDPSGAVEKSVQLTSRSWIASCLPISGDTWLLFNAWAKDIFKTMAFTKKFQ